MHFSSIVKLMSSVGGGPMQRIVNEFKKESFPIDLVNTLRPETWRSLFSKGTAGRILARLIGFGGFPVHAFFSALKASAVETAGSPLKRPILLVTTNPFYLPHLLVLTRPLHRCGVIPLMYDIYPDAFEAAGIEKKWLSRFMTIANRWMIKHADAMMYIGDVSRSSAEQRYGSHPVTYVIPTLASQAEFRDVPKALPPALSEWMDGRTIISYVGNMGILHDIETLERGIPAFLERLSPEQRDHVGFIFASSGPGDARLRKSFSNVFPDNIRFTGPLPDDQWADLLCRTEVSISTLAESAWATSIPSKTYSAVAANCIPLAIAPANSDLAHLVQSAQDGDNLLIRPGDVDALIAIFERLLDDSWRDQLHRNYKSVADANDISAYLEKYRDCFDQVANALPDSWATIAYHAAKRCFDIAAAGAGLAVIWPVLLGTAIAVKSKLGDPILFRQMRPGLDCKPFELLKFRSMANAPENTDASHDGERLSDFGKKIRALSIDELPTLLNVLRGDMSLVGPRPLLMSYLDRYDNIQIRRQWAKPGITGWAQVNGRNALDWNEKFALDVWYVEHASCLLDLKILLKTISTVLNRTGISHNNSATMPEFMGNATKG